MPLSLHPLLKMKKSHALIGCCLLAQTAFAQPADSVLTAGLPNNNFMKLQKDGGFIIRGTFNPSYTGAPAQEGSGTRLLWFPQRAAFRAGTILETQWDGANIGDASVAIGYNNRASGAYSTAFGINCTAAQMSSFAVGEQNTASGAASVALGYHAHTNARQGSFVFADRSTIDTLRAGVNHSANWRTSGGFRIWTSNTLATGVTIQSGVSVSNWGQASAVISTSTGAMLSTGGVWQNASDVNRKHLFENISGEALLAKLTQIPILEWSYKTEDKNIRHIGPMAQDFRKAFGLGYDDVSIGTVDADGISLACIQALEKRTTDQAKELADIKAYNQQLEQRLQKLESNASKKGMDLSMLSIAFLPLAGFGMWYYRRRKTKN